MITLADLLALMLTFFVLVYAMREPDTQRWATVHGEVGAILNPQQTDSPIQQSTHEALWLTPIHSHTSLSYWHSILQAKLQRAGALNIRLQLTPHALVISLPADVFFAAGSATLSPQQRPVLALLGQALEHMGHPLLLQGHTDPTPISTPEFPSNWQLSLARAAAIAQQLRHQGFTRPIRISGHAAGDFTPDMGDKKQNRRYTEARRVDMLVLDEGLKE